MDNKQNKQSDEKKKLVLSILAVLVLVLMVIGVFYAVFTYVGTGTRENRVTTGTLTFSYTEGTASINIVDAHPVSDEVGKAITSANVGAAGSIAANPAGSQMQYAGVFDFEVSASMSSPQDINYEIYATEASGNTLDAQYVKIYLTDQSDTAEEGYTGAVPTYDTLTTTSKNSGTGKTLLSDTFSNTSSKQYRLRMWISDSYSAQVPRKTFAIKVNVEADAS